MSKFADDTISQHVGLSRGRSGDLAEPVEAPLGSVGRELREAREAKGLELSQISNVLKIRKGHLAALEEDRIDKLPGRTYAIGFVRAYASYLGLDASVLSDRFKTEILGRSDEPHLVQQLDTGPDRRLPLGWVVVGLILLAGVGYGVYRLATPQESSTPAVAPVPEQAEAVNKPKALAAPAPAASEPAPTITTPDQAVTNTPSTTLPGTVPASGAPGAALPQLPPGQAYGLRNADARVVLRMHEAGFVSVRDKNGVVYLSRVLQPGDSYKVPNHGGIFLNAANGAGVELDVDGGMAGMAADSTGAVKDFPLDAQTIASRHNAAAPH